MYRSRDPGFVDRRELRVKGIAELVPGAGQTYVTAPNLQELREAKGLTLDEAAELSTYSKATISALENGAAMSRLVVSRLTAELGLSHAAAKGEI